MSEAAVSRDFNDEFQSWVLKEIREHQDPGLYSKRIHIKLFWEDEEIKKITSLARICASHIKKPAKYLEWYKLAFMAGLVYGCQEINGKIFLRTSIGYTDYEMLRKKYPAYLLSKKLVTRRKQYEDLVEKTPLLALHLIEKPIVEISFSEELTIERAEKLVSRKDIRKYLCPVLKSVSDDAFEIAKLITPILLSLSLAGTVAIPLSPILFANLAIVISKTGIAALCVGYNDKKQKDKS